MGEDVRASPRLAADRQRVRGSDVLPVAWKDVAGPASHGAASV